MRKPGSGEMTEDLRGQAGRTKRTRDLHIEIDIRDFRDIREEHSGQAGRYKGS